MDGLSKASWQKETGVLQRDDFDAGPSNLDCIEPGLWLGNLTAATDVELLEQLKLNYILTVDSCPLPRNVSSLPGMNTMFLQVTDMPKEDLLSYFQETYEFIKKGQESGEVLVHCYFGVSRSSTIVIAYLMKKYHISFNDAFQRARTKRKFVSPNPGFEAQLRLYERMNFSINNMHIQFRIFRLKVAAKKVMKVKILPRECMDVVKSDPALITVKPDPLVYRCCKCRRIVASASNLLPHVAGQEPSWKSSSYCLSLESNDICNQTYFVEPLAWMKTASQAEQGKLYCPKCNSKLGSFSWNMGCQCPCGSKMSPAFYLISSKVEWSNIVQNVQITV
ncbi:hypothetical protein AAG570_008875 [Ranatra chinensis]|uniref:Protein-tyrosine-phosphatase n=1 Tax=Ranatra chinensis TaxID=642074 RepID=A0ABD0YS48_9HEMI